MREFVDRQRERFGLIRRHQGASNRKLAIFIHGFIGNYLSTWGSLPTLLVNSADDDIDLAQWDYLFLGYSTRRVDTYLDIADLIATAWRRAVGGEPPHRHAYSSVALFGHSLGTLGIRQVLCDTANHRNGILSTLHSVTLFGTPLNGSRLAFFGAPFFTIANALKPMNPQLRMLKAWSDDSFARSAWIPVRVVLGQGDWVVGYKFAHAIEWPGDICPADQITTNHSELSKPENFKGCAVLDYIRSGLRARV